MLQVLRKTIVPRIIRLYFKSSRSFRANLGSNNSQPEIYSNSAFFMNANLLKRRRYELPHAYSINVRLKHDERGSLIQDHIQEFEAILNTIQENGKDFTVDDIMSYVNAIRSQLDDLAFEEHHISKLLSNQSFIKLFRAINRSMDQMSVDNLVTTLELCDTIRIPLNNEVCFRMIKQLNNNFEDLSFANKVSLWFFLKFFMLRFEDKTVIKKLINPVEKYIVHQIETKIHLISPENTASALAFVNQYPCIPLDVEEDVLNAVLGLKNWNDSRFFSYFIRSLWLSQSNATFCKDLYGKFLTRIRQEEHYHHLHFFLNNYSMALEKNIVDYDRHLVDDIVNKILKSSLKTKQIKSTLNALDRLSHGHKGFVDFLINFLKRNTYIYVSHPLLSRNIISYLAFFSSYVDKNQMEILKSVIKDNPNTVTMLKFERKDFDDYLYSIVNLATLGIFIDEELNYISGVLERKPILRERLKTQMFLVNLNQGVKVLHPDYSKPLIGHDLISTVLNNFQRPVMVKHVVKKLTFLNNLSNLLSVKSGVIHSILTLAMNKFGYFFDGFVAVNSEGQFYDFGVRGNTDRVFIEDISLPTDFQLIALLIVPEELLARNSLCVQATCSFRLKILEALGFPSVILYKPILKNLSDDEKGSHVYKMILEVSKKSEAETCSM